MRSEIPADADADISRAREGDADAFRRLVEPHQPALHAHCYRMLGSVHDADDALQDALLRAWRGIGRFEGRSAPRTWLHRIATNACLDALSQRTRRVLPIDYGPPRDPTAEPRGPVEGAVWIEPYPDPERQVDPEPSPDAVYEEREALELAFIAALQHLPPRQRAALILRDVLGYSAREVAEALDTTTASINSALQRARTTVDERLPSRSQQATMQAVGDLAVRRTVERFVEAFMQGDTEAILDLLADDVTFTMPPFPDWCRGRDAVAQSWLMPAGPAPRLLYAETRANGVPALGAYAIEPSSGSFRAIALDALSFGSDGISAVTAFREPAMFARFGLPGRVE